MIRKLLFGFLTLILFVGFGALGWFLGFRDGVTRAYADTGMALARYHQATRDQQADRATATLNRLTRDSAVHLLNGQHHWPLFFENPYRAQGILAEIRAAWESDAALFREPVMHYPHEPKYADYSAAYERIKPVPPERQVSKQQ